MKILLTFLALSTPAFAESLPKLVMTSPNSAKAVYPEKCANGANLDQTNRDRFFNAMLANPASRAAQLKAKLIAEIVRSGEEVRDDAVVFGDWQETYNDRDGCGQAETSWTRMVLTIVGGNTDHAVTKYLFTIDDQDIDGVRTLKVRSIQPVKIRDDQ